MTSYSSSESTCSNDSLEVWMWWLLNALLATALTELLTQM